MKINKLLFFFLICLPLVAYSSNSSDTIKVFDPTYFSNFEKTTFEAYLKTKKVDVFKLSLCVDSTMTNKKAEAYRKSMISYLNTIRPEEIKIKNEKRKIKKIFKSSHKTFFKQYDINTYCSAFYSKGKFNCVTGTVYFSNILDSLNIPFTIKEEPTHVFLLAYPHTFSLPVESTDPNMTIFIPDAGFKRRYVEFLVKSKIITKSDVDNYGVEPIFNEKYYSKVDIKPIELIGLLYYNSGISFLNVKNYRSAFHQFEKAYILYPSEKIKFLMQLSLLDIVGNMDLMNIENVSYLAKLASYSSDKSYKDIVRNDFSSITYKCIVNSDNEELYERIFNKIIPQIRDSALRVDLCTEYYHDRSRASSIKNDFDKSWYFICQAYKINPKNLDVVAMLQIEFENKIKSLNNSDDAIRKYDSIMNIYPVLKKNHWDVRMGVTLYLNEVEKYINAKDYSDGDKALLSLEKFMKSLHYISEPTLKTILSNMYSSIASAYFRKHEMKKCKAILKRGLAMIPNNPQLIRKYKIDITHEIH